MPTFAPRHIPALFLASTFTFLASHALLPVFLPFLPSSLHSTTFILTSTSSAMSQFGLPPYLSQSPDAQLVFTLYASRMVCFGLCLYVFWWKGWEGALDEVFASMGGMGVVDGLVCWKARVGGRGVFRGVMGLVLGAWGLMGGNQGRAFRGAGGQMKGKGEGKGKAREEGKIG